MTEERPGAGAWVPDRLSLSGLREAVQECRGCELYRDATQAVMGDGLRGASIMLLGGTAGKAVYGQSSVSARRADASRSGPRSSP